MEIDVNEIHALYNLYNVYVCCTAKSWNVASSVQLTFIYLNQYKQSMGRLCERLDARKEINI